MSKQEQAKYYLKAKKEKQLHAQQYPNWSAVHNYVCCTRHMASHYGTADETNCCYYKCIFKKMIKKEKSVCLLMSDVLCSRRVKKGGMTGAKGSPPPL